MEGRFVREAASLDGAGAGGEMPRGPCYAAQLAHPTLCFFSEKRFPLVSPLGRSG